MITRWRLRPAYTPVATTRPCYTIENNGQHHLAAEHELPTADTRNRFEP